MRISDWSSDVCSSDLHDIATQFDLLCATNRDLESMVKERLFREDLYYRINAVTLHVKPLRDRPEDIYWLAQRFISAMAQRLNEPPKSLHPDRKSTRLNSSH